MIVFPNAKINLGLAIQEKSASGYHIIESVFLPVAWCDVLEIFPLDSVGFSFQQTGIKIEGNPENNLVMKAARLFEAVTGITGYALQLHKVLPFGAGLGGGSSDAAFCLKALNQLHANPLDVEQLEMLSDSLGSDCSFFIRNTPAYLYGQGKELSTYSMALTEFEVCIVHPGIFISTSQAFSSCRPKKRTTFISQVATIPVSDWKDCIFNDFEKGLIEFHPQIAKIKKALYDSGAVYASLSGSGSCLYGIFKKGDIRFTDELSKLQSWRGSFLI